MGVANERSIAWGIAKKLSEHGAELAFTYFGDSLKKRVVPLAQSVKSNFTLSCDEEKKEYIQEIIKASLEKDGKEDVFKKIVQDFKVASISIDEIEIRDQMEKALSRAKEDYK